MRKISCLLILLTILLFTDTTLALENVSLEIEMPKKVQIGEDFTIDIYVKSNENISGFECRIDTPVYGREYIKFIGVSENEEIKKKAGDFYKLELKNSSLSLSFALFDKPLNSTFRLVTVKVKGLKEGVVPIRFHVVVSDENGNTVKLSPIIYNLEIGDGNKISSKEWEIGESNRGKTGDKKDRGILTWIIEVIRDFLKKIFKVFTSLL